MTRVNIDSFVLYADALSVLDVLTDEQSGRLFKAIRDYVRGEQVDDVETAVKIAFIPIKNHLDRDRAKYAEKCRRNAENGKLGGRPKKVDVEATVKVKKKKKK